MDKRYGDGEGKENVKGRMFGKKNTEEGIGRSDTRRVAGRGEGV